MLVCIKEGFRTFAEAWRETSLGGRLNFLAFMALTVAFIGFTVAGVWYTCLSNIRYAAETGTSLLSIFGPQVAAAAATTALVWLVIHTEMKKLREEEREEAESSALRKAEIQRARITATIRRLKVSVGVT